MHTKRKSLIIKALGSMNAHDIDLPQPPQPTAATSKRIAVIVDRPLYDAVSVLAKQQHRSIKAQFAHIVTQYLKEQEDGNDS